MPPPASTRHNVIAGMFVIAAALLAIVISVLVSGAQRYLAATNQYVVRFSVSEGATGIKKGSVVTLGGQEVGTVTRVVLVPGPGLAPASVDVYIAVRSSITLFEDARVLLERPLLGNLSTINIVDPGDGTTLTQWQGTGPVLEPGEVVRGRLAPPAFLAHAGYGTREAELVRTMITQASEILNRLDELTRKVREELDPTLAHLRSAAEDAHAFVGEFRARAPAWRERVEGVLARAEDLANRLTPIADQVADVVARARAAAGDVQDLVHAHRPAVERIIANVDQGVQRLTHETVPALDQTLARARTAADEFASAAARVNALLVQEAPNIERMLANLRLASNQLKLASIEVRRSPWKLLYRPELRELESETFLDAARTYADAVSDLRAAAEALRALALVPPSPLTDGYRQSADEMARRLQQAFDRYHEAERALLEEMVRRVR